MIVNSAEVLNISFVNSLVILTTKTVNEANIDDKDAYLNINVTTNQVKIKIMLSWIDKANNTPKYVATPLPPLNFNQRGKTWPKKTISEDTYINSGKYLIEISTGKKPFNISSNKVNSAKYLLPVLRTLVAPIFPDPIFLTSTFPKNFDKTKPKGIEPHT